MNNLGALYVKLNRFGDAAELFRKAIEVNPEYQDAHRILGAALIRHGEMDAAAERSEQMNPRDADAHKNLGILHLLKGEFESGWREYEWRFAEGAAKLPPLTQPRWDGDPLAGRSILLVGEQGLGDILHFARYCRLLKDAGAGRVALQCQAVLHPLLSDLEGCDELAALDAPVPVTDLYIPMMSAPAAFQTDSVERIPAPVPYLFAGEDRRRRWREELSRRFPSRPFTVGIVWQGNPEHAADARRSVPLSAFRPIAETPGVQLVSLQKGYGVEQLAAASDWGVADFGEELDADAAFLDTLAIMSCVDLMITSDTSAAHLAGAAELPVWVALCNSPDWRWMLEGDASPWYPSMRLFRQRSADDWDELFARIAGSLREKMVAEGRAACDRVLTPAAPGELIDKITILEIKRERLMGDALDNVEVELAALRETRARHLIERDKLSELERQLKDVNLRLWDIEDAIREQEREGDFGERFVELARSVYRENDRRAAIKRAINLLLGSSIVEEKSYASYGQPAGGERQ